MAKGTVKRPAYDGNACMLYDFMISQGLTEEIIMQRMGLDEERKAVLGEEDFGRSPWYPISVWIESPISIPRHYIPSLCNAIGAPIEAMFMRSRILNGKRFSLSGKIAQVRKLKLQEISSDELITELKQRGYKVYEEV